MMQMKDVKMSRGASVIVELAQVKKGEKVFVLCDYNTHDAALRLLPPILQVGAYPMFVTMPPLDRQGEAPPDPITEMVTLSDVLIAPTTTSVSHTRTRYEALSHGTRVMILPQLDEDQLAADALLADFAGLKPRIEKLAEMFTTAKTAHVTTPAGTDVTMSLEGRRGRAIHGYTQPDYISAGPCLEANSPPIEGTANGRIVVDLSIPGFGVGLLKETIEVMVVDGMAREFKGGNEANALRDMLEKMNDPLIYNIAELGVGMNPRAQATGSTLMDEAVMGTVHVALGTSYYLGGTVKASGHYDMVMSRPTLEFDGKAIVRNGELLF